jgi:hypothetical protein
MLQAHLEANAEGEALRCLWGFSREGRLVDVTLMDQLLDLAEHGVEKVPSRLAEIAKQRCALSSPEPEGLPRPGDRGLAGAIATLEGDAITMVDAVMAIYRASSPRVDEVANRFEDEEDRVEEVGALSLGIQVRGAVAPDRIARL